MKNRKSIAYKLLVLLTIIGLSIVSVPIGAQNPTGTGSPTTTIQATTPFFATVPISATAAVNTQTTLTIPAPVVSSNFNYVCSLAFELGQDGTAAAVTNAVSTSTNFNSYAVKVSVVNTVDADSGVQLLFTASPSGGCVKSAVAGTATTFVSTASLTHTAWTWYATYYQAP